MPEPLYNVLFLCTGNSACSIIAESILRIGNMALRTKLREIGHMDGSTFDRPAAG